MQNANLSTGRRLVSVPTIAVGGTDELVLFGRYATSYISAMVQVGAAPIVLKAYGLLDGESVTVQNVYAPTGAMAPYSYKGNPIVLTNALSTAVLPITGNYKLVFSGAQLGNVLVTVTTLSGAAGAVDVGALRSQLANPNLYFGPGITSTTSQNVQVTGAPWVFRAYGLTSGVSIQALNVAQTAMGNATAPLAQETQDYVLTESDNTLVLELAGTYQFQLTGDPTGVLLVGNENPVIFIDPYIPQGPQGEQGPPGTGVIVITATARTALSSESVVAIADGYAYYPDLTDPEDVSNIVGITMGAAAMNAPVQITTDGPFTENAWNWSPGLIFCTVSGGQLTQTPATTGAIIEVAKAVTATTIQTGIGLAILR
jgi:hypothetical protein